ncbi:hypothetical protein SLA2020_369110 [Shorea laevis]
MIKIFPGCVARSNGCFEIAWGDYSKTVGGGRLYIPSRFFEADITNSQSGTRNGGKNQHRVLMCIEVLGMLKLRQKSRGIREGDSISSFVMIPKNLKRAKNGSIQPGSSFV